MALMSVEEAIVEAKKGSTADGRKTVSYDDLAAAAFARGMGLVKPTAVYRKLREMGGEQVRGMRASRFAFDHDTLASIEQRAKFESIVNRLEGIAHPVTLLASLTFPNGVTIQPHEFAEGYPLASAASLKITPNNLYTAHDEPPVKTEGAWIILPLNPGSEAATNLSALVKSEHESGSHSDRLTSGHADRVSICVLFADGSSADMSHGSLVHIGREGAAENFLFFFSIIHKDC